MAKYLINNLDDMVKVFAKHKQDAINGKEFTIDIYEPKSWEQQAYFEICAKIFAVLNLERIPTKTEEEFHREKFKVACGHLKKLTTPKGVSILPRSMSELRDKNKMKKVMDNMTDVYDSYGMELPDRDEYKKLFMDLGKEQAFETIQQKYLQKITNLKEDKFDF